MTSIKVRKMDMISGLTELQFHSMCDYYNKRNNYFNNIVPDIILNRNIILLKFLSMNQNESEQYHKFLTS